MHDHWLTENWTQLMSGPDALIAEVRDKANGLRNDRILSLLNQVEQQRKAAEDALRTFGQQRQALLQTLDAIQGELAVAGHPLQGEIS